MPVKATDKTQVQRLSKSSQGSVLMKLFRTRAGDLGREPMWVAIANGIRVSADPSLAKVLDCLANEIRSRPVIVPRV